MSCSWTSHLWILLRKRLIKTALIEILTCGNTILMRCIVQYLYRWRYRWLTGIGIIHLSIWWTQAWVALSIVIDILVNRTPQSWVNSRCWTSIEWITRNVYWYLWQLTTFWRHTRVVVQMLVLFVTMTSLIVVRQRAREGHDVLLRRDLVVFPSRFWLLMTHHSRMTSLNLRNQCVKHIVINLFNSKRHLILFAIWVLAHGAVVVGGG